jgi:rare lipoprotein A
MALLSACGVVPERDREPASGIDLSSIPDAVPRVEPRSRYGNPRSYVVNGKQYFTLASARGFTQRGIASWYGQKFHGRRTSSGETYDMYKMTAAHKTLPLPTYVAVRNVSTGREIVVRVNDRGPFHGDRILDLSYAAATKLGIARKGTGLVEVQVLDPGSAAWPASGFPPIEPAPTGPIRFFVQAGAFQAAANATRLQASLSGVSRVPVRVRRTTFDDRVMYRVWLGPVSSVEDAERIASVLGALGIESPQVIVE